VQEPLVSVLVPTLNSARTLGECLRSVIAQDWPRDRLEIVVADAGSTDGTVGIAREAGAKVVDNPLKTGEAGKAAAAKAASGELFALIDSDNVLPDSSWLRRMIKPFDDPAVVASEPVRYDARPGDPPLVRYFARLGMNDPFCLFVGNYDRECAVTGRWTALPAETDSRDGFFVVRLRAGTPFPTIGANGFVIRRSALSSTDVSRYWLDVDVLRDIASKSRSGEIFVAKVETGIVHLYCASFDDFCRKQQRRVRDFLAFRTERARANAGAHPPIIPAALKFAFYTILGFPLALQAWRGNLRSPDPEAWRFHGKACRATLKIYSAAAIRKALGFRFRPADRSSWHQ
jgi:glycosyltransferase involved in cell wall biosynthesis